MSLSEHLTYANEFDLNSLYEPKLNATLTFYSNGAMRVEVDDLTKTRFKISDMEIEDLVINSKLERVKDFGSAIKDHDAYLTVSFTDTNDQ